MPDIPLPLDSHLQLPEQTRWYWQSCHISGSLQYMQPFHCLWQLLLSFLRETLPHTYVHSMFWYKDEAHSANSWVYKPPDAQQPPLSCLASSVVPHKKLYRHRTLWYLQAPAPHCSHLHLPHILSPACQKRFHQDTYAQAHANTAMQMSLALSDTKIPP